MTNSQNSSRSLNLQKLQSNKLPIIWLLFREYNSMAGLLFLRNCPISNTEKEQSKVTVSKTNSNQVNRTQSSSSKSPEKIKAWSQLISSVANLLNSLAPWIWATVLIVVIIPLFGKLFIANIFESSEIDQSEPNQEVVVNPSPNWDEIDEAVITSLQEARQSAENYADQELEIWVDDLMARVDSNFLDWYFGYFNQKQIEYKSFFTGINANLQSWLNISNNQPEEKIAEEITEDFQTEFAKRVLRPQIAQLQLERITNETIRHYLNQVQDNLQEIPVKYQVPNGDWNRYLNDISVNIYDTEGEPSSFSLKALTGGGAYFALKPIIGPKIPAISSKVVSKIAGKTGTKIATKTGGVVAGKIGTALLDTTVGVGIILWDIWDNKNTASVEKPIMRENIADYLQQVKDSLLYNSDNGIMTAVDNVQDTLIESVRSQ